MNELDQARQEIERIDREMAQLFESRLYAAEKIAHYKAQNGLPVFDPYRETVLLEKNKAYIENNAFSAYYVNFQQCVMDISKRYQSRLLEGMRITFCAVEGAFANIAAQRIFPSGTLVSFPDFESAYNAVVNGECDCCVLPIENSCQGEVGRVADLMFKGSLFVNGVYRLPVRHHLLGVGGAALTGVKKVISHPQALGQCGEYIRLHGFETESAVNTAVAAESVAALRDPSVAAIASEETAALYGLAVLDHDINASAANTTRFAVFARSQPERTASDETFILLFTVNNVVGALAKAVNIICAHGFNMRVLRSRPVRDVPWQYYFYTEAEGDYKSDEGERMLRELRVCCDSLKVVGHFPAERDLLKEKTV